MKAVTLEQLLEAGCHFGHQVTRQNPRAKEFIYQERDGIHVIDLAKTREELLKAGEFVKNLASKGGTILFIGTKRQAQEILKEEAARANVYVITDRWVGGLLTNFEQMQKNFKRLKDLQNNLESEEWQRIYTKRERGLWEKEKMKLERLYGSVVDMNKLPDAVFIVDTHKEDLAVREARLTNIAIVGMVDTNADPTIIDYPIPANDDAVGSVKLIVSYIADAWLEGKKNQAEAPKAEESKEKKSEEKTEEKEEAVVDAEKSPRKTQAKAKDTEGNEAKPVAGAGKKAEKPAKKATKKAVSVKK